MTHFGPHADGSPLVGHPAEPTSHLSEMLKHLTIALCHHVRQRHREGLPVPPEIEELTALLVFVARTRQAPPVPAAGPEASHAVHVPERLLVTKNEAAERLGVSVRTIERLVAARRLPQVHVERLARFRVSDLEAFAESLGEGQDPCPDSEGDDGRG